MPRHPLLEVFPATGFNPQMLKSEPQKLHLVWRVGIVLRLKSPGSTRPALHFLQRVHALLRVGCRKARCAEHPHPVPPGAGARRNALCTVSFPLIFLINPVDFLRAARSCRCLDFLSYLS